jgi:hypothetical protein
VSDNNYNSAVEIGRRVAKCIFGRRLRIKQARRGARRPNFTGSAQRGGYLGAALETDRKYFGEYAEEQRRADVVRARRRWMRQQGMFDRRGWPKVVRGLPRLP